MKKTKGPESISIPSKTVNPINWDEIYNNCKDILAHPEQHKEVITHFGAGGCGGGSSWDVTLATLVKCWKHEEFHFPCPECGADALITHYAGHVNNGRFWAIDGYCPSCHKTLHVSRPGPGMVKTGWRELKEIEKFIKNKSHEEKQ